LDFRGSGAAGRRSIPTRGTDLLYEEHPKIISISGSGKDA